MAPQTDIILCTLNARFAHCAFGLRYLYAQLEELQPRTRLLEFTISQSPQEIVETLLTTRPRIIGLGVYIWNTRETELVVDLLKAVAPEITVVLGGPEVSYETDVQSICAKVDHVVIGEGDWLFRDLARQLLSSNPPPLPKKIQGELPLLDKLSLPYAHYSDEDIRNRVIYVEASRGCPYKCEYCLSSLDKEVRSFPLETFLAEMDRLIERGARQFKFVDRTFNLKPSTSVAILEFFLQRIERGLFLHFEMVPDRLPAELKALIEKFPAGSLQFEIGIQTWNPEVSALVSRRQNYTAISENLRYLRARTGVHTHADLIVGLPGETPESFGRGFDALLELDPDEIQVGILKRLRGTPIVRHDQEWAMRYQPFSPYTLLQSRTLSFNEMQAFTRFAKYWDLVANSGNFPGVVKILKTEFKASRAGETGSAFRGFWALSEFIWERLGARHSIALANLAEALWDFTAQYFAHWSAETRENFRLTLATDYSAGGTRTLPKFLWTETIQTAALPARKLRSESAALPERQQRRRADQI